MSGLVKFFTKKKNSNKENKENDASLKRVNFERASTRSEVGADTQQQQRERAMRAIPNPYSVWTEPKKTKAPSSCPGGIRNSTTYYEDDEQQQQRRSSVRPPKRAGSVYGDMRDMSGLRQYRIDGPSPDGGGGSSSGSHHGGSISGHNRSSHSHAGVGHRASRRYGGELSMIEERSERSDRSFHHQQQQQQQQQHVDWNRSSTRRPPPPPSHSQQYDDYNTSGDSDDYDETVRRLEHKIGKLKDDKNRYRNQLERKTNDLEYSQYQLKKTEEQLGIQLDRAALLETNLSKCCKQMKKLQEELMRERNDREMLTLRLSEMSTSATSNGAMERLVSSSETSLEMDEGEGGRDGGEEEDEEREEGNDEVRNFRASDSAVTTATTGGTAGGGGSSSTPATVTAAPSLAVVPSPPSESEEMELPRTATTPSPQFELRRSFSDMGPVTMIDGACEEMAEMGGGGGGSWRRRGDTRRRSFVKRPLLPPSQESESSDGERILLMERQVRKKERGVVKYDPNKRMPVKEKHYRRFGKPERSALDGFTFLEQEITDVSGMLSSPSEGNY